MLPQLLLVKRLALEAEQMARRDDAVAAGLAISLLQDAVELYVWTVIKEKGLVAKDQAPFTANLDVVAKGGYPMPQVAKLLELNKSRVNFKHYGNLPAPAEAIKFQTYAYDCLRDAMSQHFSVDISALSLVDLVTFPDVRARLKEAEHLLQGSNLKGAAGEAAKAKGLLFSKLDRYIPPVDGNLRSVDRLLNEVADGSSVNPFAYLTEYLDGLRQVLLLSLAQVPARTYMHMRETLPPATQFAAGNWRIRHAQSAPNEADVRRVIAELVSISLRIQGLVS